MLAEGGGNNVIQDIIHLQTWIEGLACNNKTGHLIVIIVVLLLLIGTHHH